MPMSIRISMAVVAGGLVLCATDTDAHDCKCRNRGVMFELGQMSCLHVDGTSYMARCEMKLNVSSWTKVEDGCPISDAGNAPPLIH